MNEQTATGLTALVLIIGFMVTSPFILLGALILWALLGWFGVILECAMLYGIYSAFGSAFRGVLTRRQA